MVHKDFPARNVQEFVAHVKSRPPGSISYASSGVGAGLILGGRPFRGARGTAGEIGPGSPVAAPAASGHAGVGRPAHASGKMPSTITASGSGRLNPPACSGIASRLAVRPSRR